MIVMKFGGSSLATAERIRGCIALVRQELARQPVLVVSACGGVTDLLSAAASRARQGRVDTAAIDEYHLGLLADLELDRRVIEPLLDQLAALLHGVSLIRELTDRTRDLVLSFGERMSARIVAAAMDGEGVPATAVNAFQVGLVTDSAHGAATPLEGIEQRLGAEIRRIDLVPVLTGFLGVDEKGDITTLGRSGSDYTAAIVGAAVGAEEVQIWTDVDGVMTCDPSLDDRAANLPLLSFEEASELAYFGAAVLHPATLIPAIRQGIPVRVLNTMRPSDRGTKIVERGARTPRLAKAVVYKEDVSLIHLSSPRLTSAVNVLAAALEIAGRHRVGIHMANTSEATVSLVTTAGVDRERLAGALADLARLGPVVAETGKVVICVVGEELKGTAGVLGRIFGAVAARGIKAKLVSQSASEINVAFLVDEAELVPAVHALHELLLTSE